MSLYEERYNRILAAVALEPVDKVPVIIGGSAMFPKIAGITAQKYLDDPEANMEAAIKSHILLGNVDGTQGALFHPAGMCFGWLSQIKMPGYEPVSYTHLDVYKRQALTCLSQILLKLQQMTESSWSHVRRF